MSSGDKLAAIIAVALMTAFAIAAVAESCGKGAAADACFKAGHTVQECKP